MKYYQLASITTPQYIQDWLKIEFEKRGIDEVYVRCILSILHASCQNPEPVDCQESSSQSGKICQKHGAVYVLQYSRTKPKKGPKKNKTELVQSVATCCEPFISWDVRDKNKKAALDCLLSTYSDIVEEDVEELIDKLFIKLRDHQDEVPHRSEENAEPPSPRDEAEQYSLAFPPLNNTTAVVDNSRAKSWVFQEPCRTEVNSRLTELTFETILVKQPQDSPVPATYKDTLLITDSALLATDTNFIEINCLQPGSSSLEKEIASDNPHKPCLKRSFTSRGFDISSAFKIKRLREEGFYEEEAKKITYFVDDNMCYTLPTDYAKILARHINSYENLSNTFKICIVEVLVSAFAAIDFFKQLAFVSAMRTNFLPLPEFTANYKNMYTWPLNVLPSQFDVGRNGGCLAISNEDKLIGMEEENVGNLSPYCHYVSAATGDNFCQLNVSASGANHSSCNGKSIVTPEYRINNNALEHHSGQQVILRNNIQNQQSNFLFFHPSNISNGSVSAAIPSNHQVFEELTTETISHLTHMETAYPAKNLPPIGTPSLPTFLFSKSSEKEPNDKVNSHSNNLSGKDNVTKVQMVCETCYSKAQTCNHADIICSEIPKFPGWHLKKNIIHNGKSVNNPWFHPAQSVHTTPSPVSSRHFDDQCANHMQNTLDALPYDGQNNASCMTQQDEELPHYVHSSSVCISTDVGLDDDTLDYGSMHYDDSNELQYNSAFVSGTSDSFYDIAAAGTSNESHSFALANDFALPDIDQCYDISSFGYSRWSVQDQYDNDSPGSVSYPAAMYPAFSRNTESDSHYHGMEAAAQYEQNAHHRQLSVSNSVVSDEVSKKICYYYAVGECPFAKCKYSHELSNITCRYWLQGSCFKDSTCPFLHALPPNPRKIEPVQRKKTECSKHSCSYKLDSEVDFPTLSQVAMPTKSKPESKTEDANDHLTK